MTKLVWSTTGCRRSHQGELVSLRSHQEESKCLGQNRQVILCLQQLHPGLHDSHKCCSIRLHILLVKTMKFYSIKTVYTNDSSSAHIIDTYTHIIHCILCRDMMVLMADQALLDQKALRYVETSDSTCQLLLPGASFPNQNWRQGMCIPISLPGLTPRLGWRFGIEARAHTLELGQ